jgi:hypothetical protein
MRRPAKSRTMRGGAFQVLFALFALTAANVFSQGGRGASGPRPTARESAPFDLTGYWVSVITQNWRFRMVTPAKGDYLGIPLTAEAKKIADAWDPAKDEAAGLQCKSYGAAAIMNVPGRLHITWQDGDTLRMDTDSGTQTRLFHFGDWSSPGGKPTWQGESLASWTPRRGPAPAPSTPKARYLKVVTTHMLPGYLRKNGVPYSENAVLTEYYDLIQEPDGINMLIVTTVVEDPVYLQNPLILTAQFKKQADASGWDPTPCSSTW